jgi:hypothetical protein
LTKVDVQGNLPLHYAAMVKPPTSSENTVTSGHFPAFYTKYVVDELLYKFPEAANMTNGDAKFPLELAISTGKQWIGGGIKSLYDPYPQALEKIDLEEHASFSSVVLLLFSDVPLTSRPIEYAAKCQWYVKKITIKLPMKRRMAKMGKSRHRLSRR